MGVFEQLKQMLMGAPETIPDNAVIIDVRSQGEYIRGHIDGAVLIPVEMITAKIKATVPDKQTPIVVYCASGMRSASARSALLSMGFQTVINVGGLGAATKQLNKPII